LYDGRVIRSFRDKDTEAIFQQRRVRAFQRIARVALRRLVQIDSAETLRDLASPPANRLEALKGDRAGRYSVRINDQYRICFRWKDGHAFEVEITDYH
jgi:proteic killer suppression protein